MKNIKGFTLIELLVVVAIIGILSTIAMSSFNNAQQKARDGQRKSDLDQIRKALELAKADDASGYYYMPAGCSIVVDKFAALKTFLQGGASGTGAVYMKTVPNDPRGGNWNYFYFCGQTDYTLIACLENLADPKGDIAVLGAKSTYCSLSGQVNSKTFKAP